MHERQYLDYKSGIAKKRFEEDLAKTREAKNQAEAPAQNTAKTEVQTSSIESKYPNGKWIQAPAGGKIIWNIDFEDKSTAPIQGTPVKEGQILGAVQAYYGMENIVANYSGKIAYINAPQGQQIQKGQIIAVIE